MPTKNITKEEVYALTDMVEQAVTDASFNDVDEQEREQLDLVRSLLAKLEDEVLK